MVMQNFDPAIFSDFFETDDLGRRALFQSTFGQDAQSQQQGSQLFIPTFNQFLGNLGRSLRAGTTPESFQDFATNTSGQGFNQTRALASLPQGQTPGLQSRVQFGF